MQQNGWTLLFHDCIIEQLRALHDAVLRAEENDPEGFESNANVKVFRSLSQLITEAIPNDPGRDEYRQGNTLRPDYRHWRRAKFNQRFRLFFRYDSKARVIVFAWVNDEKTLRQAGGKNDPYAVFQKMLARGNPPDDWDKLAVSARADWQAPRSSRPGRDTTAYFPRVAGLVP